MITINVYNKAKSIKNKRQTVADFNHWFTINICKILVEKFSSWNKKFGGHVFADKNDLNKEFDIFSVDSCGKSNLVYEIAFSVDYYTENVTLKFLRKGGWNKQSVVTIPIEDLIHADEEYLDVKKAIKELVF